MFRDRYDAGEMLAERLREFAGRRDVIVLALPRGGVPVGYVVARELGVPLDVFVVRKLGTPGQPELAMGAIASGGVRVLNREVVDALGIPEASIEEVSRREEEELQRRERQYRGDRPSLDVSGKTGILVDDGLATGSSMRAAAAALRQAGAARIVIAVPVASRATCDQLREEGNDVVCATTPEPFFAVGQWYKDFAQTTDEEVRELLDRAVVEKGNQ
ncbi:MAG TPA: phosphoribosyltransferase [Terriglobales bacterium]|nr:phosphoribosyltransferase [Terriglobales bacterium]